MYQHAAVSESRGRDRIGPGRPAFAASLLRDLLNVEVPHFTEARLTEAALNQLVPVGYYADAVVLFVDFVDQKK